MSRIYALLVAIDQYPNPEHQLQGCNHDMTSVKNYLTNSYGDQVELKILADEEATRKNIISGFDHFAAAKDGDTCLFYYSGHGSQAPADAAFWHMAPNKMNDSLVCWDSRQEGGYDLMNQELSYLISQANKDKDLHFLSWMDCCNAGTNTRSTNEVRLRMIIPNSDTLPSSSYYGISDYEQTETSEGVQLNPPNGKHIQLLATSNSELAKELSINGQPRGIFTYLLLETLEEYSGNVSYNELINRVRIKIRNRVSNQSPKVVTTHPEDNVLPFLNQHQSNNGSHLLSHDPSLGWVVNAGTKQGVDISQNEEHSLFKTKAGILLETKNLMSDQSIINSIDGSLDPSKAYNVQHISPTRKKITLAIADIKETAALVALLKKSEQGLLQVVGAEESPRYHIGASQAGLVLVTPDNYDEPILHSGSGHDEFAAMLFLDLLEKVARWLQILEATNPLSTIQSNELEFSFFRTTDPGNFENDVAKEKLDWTSSNLFTYLQDKEWEQPGLQLKITNSSNRSIWVAALYLGFDFSITNQLLSNQELKPGESVWLTDVFDGEPYHTIPLQIEDGFYETGVVRIKEYIKVLASSSALETAPFNQPGLLEEHFGEEAAPKTDKPLMSREKNWTSWEIEVDIYRPWEA